MNHQPFEEWLLTDEPLSPEQTRALQDHLQTCTSCQPLAETWEGIRKELEAAPQAAPAPGFGQRWQVRLVKKQAQEQRRRLWLAGGSGLALLAGGFILAVPLLARLSPANILIGMVYGLTLLVVKASQIGVWIGTTFNGIFVVIPIAAWIIIATTLSLLGLVWAFTMWKIFIPKGVKAL